MAMVTAMVMAMGIDRDGDPQRRAIDRFGTIVPRLTAVGCCKPRGRRARAAALIALSLAASSAQTQTVRIGETLAVTETFTNNVNLTPSGSAKSDLVSEITPSVSIDARGAHSSLQGNIGVPIVLYARTGSENNKAYVNGDLTGSFEAIDKFFFIEAQASASQQYITPFGATPVGLTNATNNRYTSITYRLSPYVKGVTSGNITYLLRLNAVWGNLYNVPTDVGNTHYTELIGNLASPVAPWGWAVDLSRTDVKFTDQSPQITQLVRLRLIDQIDPQLQLSGSLGYEDNQYPLTDYRGAIYGIAAKWRPTERTSVDAGWEHRFFGASYLFAFEHRTALSVWNADFSRNITSYPQQLAALAAGVNVSSLLNDLLSTRIPDPTQRQAAVNQLISDRGLPQILGAPVNLYTQQILLQQNGSFTIGLLGVNNAIFLRAFDLKSQPITGSGTALPPDLSFGNNNTQRGATVTWTYALSPFTNLVGSAGASKTYSNVDSSITTDNYFVRVSVNWRMSPLTNVQFGARYQVQHGDFQGGDYNEAAVFAGFQYRFQ
jgi:uncharacterized protein (PEP-CTERM system associated)